MLDLVYFIIRWQIIINSNKTCLIAVTVLLYTVFRLRITGLEDQNMRQVEWETSRVHELDLSSTELSTECLKDVLMRMPGFTYLGLAHCEFFNDAVRRIVIFFPVQYYFICHRILILLHQKSSIVQSRPDEI